jgi:hypothetical protein
VARVVGVRYPALEIEVVQDGAAVIVDEQRMPLRVDGDEQGTVGGQHEVANVRAALAWQRAARSFDEVENGHSVPDWRQQRISVEAEHDVPTTVHRAAKVRELRRRTYQHGQARNFLLGTRLEH